MKIPLKRAINFITTNGYFLGLKKEENLKLSLLENKNEISYTQLSMFSSLEILNSVISGEI